VELLRRDLDITKNIAYFCCGKHLKEMKKVMVVTGYFCMKHILIIAIALSCISLMSVPVAAETKKDQISDKQKKTGKNFTLKYNAIEREWTYTKVSSILKYNPVERKWSYVPENSNLKYNIFEKKWELAPDNYRQKYNPFERRWETTHPESKLKYNPLKAEFEYQEPEK
jgi:hypothetical protein